VHTHRKESVFTSPAKPGADTPPRAAGPCAWHIWPVARGVGAAAAITV
jgi:hypothetical protein